MRPTLDIALDRSACLHRQLLAALSRAIQQGDLPRGERLPSTRALARHLSVSRNTVLAAYEELAADGLIAGRIGSGTRVSGRAPIPRLPDPRELLRESHYPSRAVPIYDPDGNRLNLQC